MFLEKLSGRKDKDKKYDKSVMSNQVPKEEHISFGECELVICEEVVNEIEDKGYTVPPCEYYQWGGMYMYNLTTNT